MSSKLVMHTTFIYNHSTHKVFTHKINGWSWWCWKLMWSFIFQSFRYTPSCSGFAQSMSTKAKKYLQWGSNPIWKGKYTVVLFFCTDTLNLIQSERKSLLAQSLLISMTSGVQKVPSTNSKALPKKVPGDIFFNVLIAKQKRSITPVALYPTV